MSTRRRDSNLVFANGLHSFPHFPLCRLYNRCYSGCCDLDRCAIVMSLTCTPACAHCASDLCIFIIPECQHAFHTRCVAQWPIKACPVCQTPTTGLELFPSAVKSSKSRTRTRNGKWTPEEEAYVHALLHSFLHGYLFCANGTSVRTALSKSLHCSPMRLSKKFQKRPLGKHSFRLPETRRIHVGEAHLAHQKILSALEVAFHQSIQQQLSLSSDESKVESSKAESSKAEVGEEYLGVVEASRQFWVEQFLAFAAYLGQSVNGYDFQNLPCKPRKRKRPKVLDERPSSQPWIHQPPAKARSSCLSRSSSSSSLQSDDCEENCPPEPQCLANTQLSKVSLLDTFEFNPDWMFHSNQCPNMMVLQPNSCHVQPQVTTQPHDESFLLPLACHPPTSSTNSSSEEEYFTDSTASASNSPAFHHSFTSTPEILHLDFSDFALSSASSAPFMEANGKWWSAAAALLE